MTKSFSIVHETQIRDHSENIKGISRSSSNKIISLPSELTLIFASGSFKAVIRILNKRFKGSIDALLDTDTEEIVELDNGAYLKHLGNFRFVVVYTKKIVANILSSAIKSSTYHLPPGFITHLKIHPTPFYSLRNAIEFLKILSKKTLFMTGFVVKEDNKYYVFEGSVSATLEVPDNDFLS